MSFCRAARLSCVRLALVPCSTAIAAWYVTSACTSIVLDTRYGPFARVRHPSVLTDRSGATLRALLDWWKALAPTFRNYNDSRAGDRPRSGDVQLGKLAVQAPLLTTLHSCS